MAGCAKALSETPKLQVDSLMLLEAAFSHFGFSADNGHGTSGFFRDVIVKQVVKGPFLSTFSAEDTVVGNAYAIMSRLAGDNTREIGDASDEFGGIGRNGPLKTKEVANFPLNTPGTAYEYKTGRDQQPRRIRRADQGPRRRDERSRHLRVSRSRSVSAHDRRLGTRLGQRSRWPGRHARRSGHGGPDRASSVQPPARSRAHLASRLGASSALHPRRASLDAQVHARATRGFSPAAAGGPGQPATGDAGHRPRCCTIFQTRRSAPAPGCCSPRLIARSLARGPCVYAFGGSRLCTGDGRRTISLQTGWKSARSGFSFLFWVVRVAGRPDDGNRGGGDSRRQVRADGRVFHRLVGARGGWDAIQAPI